MQHAMVIAGLVKRRAQLAGDIEAAHEALRGMIRDLEHLDATIQQFDPTYQVEAIRPKAFRPPKDWANRGEMSRIVLSILRQAAEPLTSRDIALQLLVERALDKAAREFIDLFIDTPAEIAKVGLEKPTRFDLRKSRIAECLWTWDFFHPKEGWSSIRIGDLTEDCVRRMENRLRWRAQAGIP